jgi:hypothetical protein
MRKQKAYSRNGKHGYYAHNRTPSSKVVHRNQRMRPLAYPPNSRIRARRSKYTEHGDTDSCSSLRGRDGIVIGGKSVRCCIYGRETDFPTSRRY